MRKVMLLLLLLFSFPVYAAQWTVKADWSAITGPDADAAINIHCDVNAPATTLQGQGPPGSTSLTFTVSANQGDALNCFDQLVRTVGGQDFFGVQGAEVAKPFPFLAPGAAPAMTITITPASSPQP